MKKRWQERILQEIREAVAAVAKAGNYTMVMDTGNRFDAPVLLYTSGQDDLTDKVLVELNSRAPSSASLTPEKEEKPAVGLPAPGTSGKKPEQNATDKPRDSSQKSAPPATKPGRTTKKP